mmetsp:Transcript_28801/g.53946  ORF Transcript_28801/g.53946 Transcript_28801/m.53946 type:complete len:215 (-) Transcript_28801:39-683(-)
MSWAGGHKLRFGVERRQWCPTTVVVANLHHLVPHDASPIQCLRNARELFLVRPFPIRGCEHRSYVGLPGRLRGTRVVEHRPVEVVASIHYPPFLLRGDSVIAESEREEPWFRFILSTLIITPSPHLPTIEGIDFEYRVVPQAISRFAPKEHLVLAREFVVRRVLPAHQNPAVVTPILSTTANQDVFCSRVCQWSPPECGHWLHVRNIWAGSGVA